ncbi:phosphotransferase enzyme family protein [Amycolatopsis suaedae]|uniref:Aminoglycoside phosphotransferase family protein n=1 Tax=Amycolatopsis suaedae TaxID=2510978 RepID=A0A4Q7J2Q9_9PSEU|nr:phosphotransferase [Amycolatopsis suaedae]RZQ61207.1 aminoglycoside phosphotransferase family protein [Amycolatopsis suaedae]
MDGGTTTRAVAAAVEAAVRFGLPAAEPVVLAEKSNVLVRLGNVVARVPGTTALTRPAPTAALARDVALCTFLAERGAPVVPPCSDPPAGPHLVDDLPVTLWRYVEHDPSALPEPALVGRSLAELHAVLRDYPGDLPANGPLTEVERIIGQLAADPEWSSAVPRLRAEADRVTAMLDGLDPPRQALHGDAHPGNLLVTPEGLRWIDFEDTWLGPVEYDMATVVHTMRPDGVAALAAYPDSPDVSRLQPWLDLRRLFGLCWRFVIARRTPSRTPEAWAALSSALGGR